MAAAEAKLDPNGLVFLEYALPCNIAFHRTENRSLTPGLAEAAERYRYDEVFILDRDSDTGKDVVRCLSLATGKDNWSYSYKAPGKFSHNGSRSVPAVDADYVYTVGALGDFYCISRKTHKPVWKKQLVKDFGGKKPMWVVAQSPLLYDDLVIDEPPIRLPRTDVLKYSFVLRPMQELAPDLVHPVSGRTMAEHWQEFDQDSHPLLLSELSF